MMNERAEADETGEPMTLYQTKTASDWCDLYEIYMFFSEMVRSEWIFRGDNPDPEYTNNQPEGAKRSDRSHADVLKDGLRSHLDKAFDTFEVIAKDRPTIEQNLIREFKRRAHLYYDDSMGTDKPRRLDYMALMNHHEAPTRMMDWTYSFWLGVYFAINKAEKKKTEKQKDKKQSAVVWALDSKWLDDKNDPKKRNEPYRSERGSKKEDRKSLIETFVHKKVEDAEKQSELKKKSAGDQERKKLEDLKTDWPNKFCSEVVNWLISENPDGYVYCANPYFLNERLAIQRGVFLVQSSIKKSLGENFVTLLSNNGVAESSESEKPLWKIRIEFDVERRKEILRRLYDMRISRETLFPDMDGFAKSLWARIAYPETLRVFDE